MPRHVICTSCQARLRVPDEFTGPWLTCPHCLAKYVPVTSREFASEASPSIRVRCPHCATALHVKDSATADPVTCPHCLARIPNFAVLEAVQRMAGIGANEVMSLSLGKELDDDIRRDTKLTGCFIVLISPLLMVGSGLLIVRMGANIDAIFGAFIVIVALAFIFIAQSVFAHGADSWKVIQFVLLSSFLILGAVVAFYVLIFVVCVLWLPLQ